MDDTCGECAEPFQWVAYGPCGHSTVCSLCVARLRLTANDHRCSICKAHSTIIFVTRASGKYTRMIRDFGIFPSNPCEGRVGSYWFDENLKAYFDDSDHYKMIKAMCSLWCHLCERNCRSKCNGEFRNIGQLKSHLFHDHKLYMCPLCLEARKVFVCEQKLYSRKQLDRHVDTGDLEVDGDEFERGGFMGHPICDFCKMAFYGNSELYSHMSIEHYTCYKCLREDPGLIEYYKDYEALEKHFDVYHSLDDIISPSESELPSPTHPGLSLSSIFDLGEEDSSSTSLKQSHFPPLPDKPKNDSVVSTTESMASRLLNRKTRNIAQSQDWPALSNGPMRTSEFPSSSQSTTQSTMCSSYQIPSGAEGNKRKNKASKFHKIRLGDGSLAAFLDSRHSDAGLHPGGGTSASDLSVKSLVGGAWRNGGGQRLVAVNQTTEDEDVRTSSV